MVILRWDLEQQSLYRAVLENGVLNVPARDSGEVLR